MCDAGAYQHERTHATLHHLIQQHAKNAALGPEQRHHQQYIGASSFEIDTCMQHSGADALSLTSMHSLAWYGPTPARVAGPQHNKSVATTLHCCLPTALAAASTASCSCATHHWTSGWLPLPCPPPPLKGLLQNQVRATAAATATPSGSSCQHVQGTSRAAMH